MGGSQSVENFRAMTTPGYQPKAPKRKVPHTQPTGITALGMTDFIRTAADPAYRPKAPKPPAPRPTGVAGLGMTDLIRTAADPTYRPKVDSAMSSGRLVVAIDQRFCSASSVTLHLREKFFSLSGDSFSIRDVSTNTVWFRIAGKALSIREKKTLLDARGAPVASMKEEFFSLMPSYHVSSNTSGASLFEIHCKFSLFSTDLRVEFTNKATKQRCKMGLSGDWVHRKASIWLETSGSRRETVGRVYRPLTAGRNIVLGTQDYYLEIAPNVDMALLVLICVVLDEKASD